LSLNEAARFECAATGNPLPLIYWRKERSQELYLPGHRSDHFSLSQEGTLQIEALRKEDLGTYICTALSAAGSTEISARLEVTSQDQQPPPIINVGPRNQTLPLKSMAAFPCEALGRPPPATKWMKDGREVTLEKDSRLTVSPNGTLQINGKQRQDK